MSDPLWLRLAKADIGTHEVPGPKANPKIMAMFADVGHDWVTDDVVPWCAALVGSTLKRAGEPYLETLRAREYVDYGLGVSLENAIPGDILVLSRGPNPAFGHVLYFLRSIGSQIEGLGGNQTNAVTVARYPKSRVIAVRRPVARPVTLATLARDGSRIASAASSTAIAGKVIAGTGATGAAVEIIDQVGGLSGMAWSLEPLKEFFDAYGPWIALAVALAVAGFGVHVWRQGRKAGAARLADAQSGKTMGVGAEL